REPESHPAIAPSWRRSRDVYAVYATALDNVTARLSARHVSKHDLRRPPRRQSSRFTEFVSLCNRTPSTSHLIPVLPRERPEKGELPFPWKFSGSRRFGI